MGDAATRGEITTDNDPEDEVGDIGETKHEEPPELTSSENDTSDGSGDDSPKEPGSDTSKVEGRGPGKRLMHVAAPENVAVDGFNTHSMKDTGDPKDLSKEIGLNEFAAGAP